MGQGCNSNCNNYFEKKTPDTAITYTGPAIPSLGICTGDILSEIEAVLLQKIIDYSTGVGISIPSIDLTTCALFSSDLICCNTCTDLHCLMQAYLTAICTLYGDFTTLQTEVTALLNGPYNTACLTLGANPTLTQIIQELILEFCSLVQTVTTLSSTVTNLSSTLTTTIGTYLASHITSQQGPNVLNVTGTGASTTFNLRGFTPIGGIMPYAGPLAGKFDSTGLGLTNNDVYGYALCNGNNGTVDLREQFIVGVGHGVMGGTNNGPSNISNLNYGLNAITGEAFHTLITAEIPSFSFTGTTSGSTATTTVGQQIGFQTAGTGNNGILYPPFSYPSDTQPLVTVTTTIPPQTITGTTGGSSSKHNNVPPATALYYIQRIL